MSIKAPFHAELAKGVAKGAAVWLQTRDGLRIRAGHWPALFPKTKGTVLILPGRTEYIEKYDALAAELGSAGWASLAIDWRGQGRSERLAQDPLLGHVWRFTDYQKDLDAVLDWLLHEGEPLGLAPPFMLFAHSMGGLIGLRALYRDLPLRAAVFSAPMWGIWLPLRHRPMAALLSRSQIALRKDLAYAPTAAPISYVAAAAFAGNLLTSDPARWQEMKDQLAQMPEVALGGPSLRWVREALREARGLLRRPAPQLPALVGLGGREAIVLPKPIRARLADWPKARLDFYPEARHELAHERDEIRSLFIARMLRFIEEQL